MDGKQNPHVTTGGSSEEATTPGLSLFLRYTGQSDEPQATFVVSMLACSPTSESSVKHLALQPECRDPLKIGRPATESCKPEVKTDLGKTGSMPDDKYDLEPFHRMISCKFTEMLNLPDILPLTSGRNHPHPNQNFPGVGSQPLRFLTHTGAKTTIKETKKRVELAAQARPGPALIQIQTLISETPKYSQK